MTKKNKIKSKTGIINPCYDILVRENNNICISFLKEITMKNGTCFTPPKFLYFIFGMFTSFLFSVFAKVLTNVI